VLLEATALLLSLRRGAWIESNMGRGSRDVTGRSTRRLRSSDSVTLSAADRAFVLATASASEGSVKDAE